MPCHGLPLSFGVAPRLNPHGILLSAALSRYQSGFHDTSIKCSPNHGNLSFTEANEGNKGVFFKRRAGRVFARGQSQHGQEEELLHGENTGHFRSILQLFSVLSVVVRQSSVARCPWLGKQGAWGGSIGGALPRRRYEPQSPRFRGA
jgi:hypothetical protein